MKRQTIEDTTRHVWTELHYAYIKRPCYAFGPHAFLPVEPTRYLKTDVCAAYVECEACGALAGEPCRRVVSGTGTAVHTHSKKVKALTKSEVRRYGIQGAYTTGTHYRRREAYKAVP